MREPLASQASITEPRRASCAFWLMGLFLAELVALTILYQFYARLECMATDAEFLCRGLRSLVSRTLSIAALTALLIWAKPDLLRRFLLATRREMAAPLAVWAHWIGVAMLLVPLLLASEQNMASEFTRYAVFWGFGAVLAAGGGLAWLLPPRAWGAVAAQDRVAILLTIAVGAVLPDVADLALPLWSHWPALTSLTFHSVAQLLQLTGLTVYVDAPGFVLGLQSFAVHVAQQCSGVEGMALVSAFVLVYAVLFRDRLYWGRYWLVVLPLGLLFSWILNVVRIAALILIGEYISPNLAVNGFHSFAGTLFFTLLALGLMWVVQATAWLHRAPQREQGSIALRHDWLAARIWPFILFMLLSSLVSAIFPEPELGYPIKAIGMVVALWVFFPVLRVQNWHPSAVAVLVGMIVGIAWVLLADPTLARKGEISSALSGLSLAGLVLWTLLRVAGTTILVPIVEELFFRGYLLARFSGPSHVQTGAALILSSAAFGFLHGRWFEGMASGLIFGLLYLHRRRVSDPVFAHIMANGVVAGCALLWQDWSLI